MYDVCICGVQAALLAAPPAMLRCLWHLLHARLQWKSDCVQVRDHRARLTAGSCRRCMDTSVRSYACSW